MIRPSIERAEARAPAPGAGAGREGSCAACAATDAGDLAAACAQPNATIRRGLPWLGGLFIAAIVALAALDIWRGYANTTTETMRELETLSRVIAEQTAGSVQTVDRMLQHVAAEVRAGRIDPLADEAALHAYLRDQSIGLIQVAGLSIIDAHGRIRASSSRYPQPDPRPSVAELPAWQQLQTSRDSGLIVAPTMRGINRPNLWIFPIGRRLEGPDGRFAGAIVAAGRVEYFQDFYRDVRLDEGTAIMLTHRDGTLIARQPPLPEAPGRRYPGIDTALSARDEGHPKASRRISMIDGVDRFGAAQLVADYPLAVTVTRDAAVALAGWRRETAGTVVRTLALALLATGLLVAVQRQLRRLERSRERFALAAAGSDEGIWDWDVASDRIFASARAREIYGLPPGPDVLPRQQWFTLLRLHPADVAARREALRAHLAGQTPVYAGEYRVRDADGRDRWVRVRGLCVRDAHGVPLRMAGSVTDIDARKRAEDALRLSEERYALAMTGSTGGHWVWEPQTDALFVSGTVNQLFDQPAGLEPTSRAEYFSRVRLHPDDVPKWNQIIGDVANPAVKRIDLEFRVLPADGGEPRWILTRAQCFRDDAGCALRVAGVSVDITERKRTEQALRESEQRFAHAVAGANDGILDWDIVADRMFASDRAMRMVGLEPDDRVRTRAEWAALVMPRMHPDDLPRLKAELHGTEDSPPEAHEGEYRVRGADGGYRWMRFRGRVVRDAAGRAMRWAGSVSDVDALKKTEEALRRSEQRYQLAVDGSNEGLWDWDLASDSLFLSPRAQQLLWQRSGEPQRPRREWIALTAYHPDDMPLVRAALAAHLRGTTKHFKVEYRLRHHSGEWRWYRQRGIAVRDAGGRPTRMAGSMEDITDRKQVEAERERLELQLRQAQKLEAIGTLAGGIAHDFNNILAAILGYGEMVQKDAPEGSAVRRNIDAAMSAGMRAKSLVERILAFSRSGMGERVPVHMQSVVGEALDAVAASLPPGVTLERRLDCGNAAVHGDPTQVHQVVLNLCANAVQAMKSNGTLSVTLELAQLDSVRCAASVLPAGSYVRLGVRDTGSGIEPHLLERIFDPFFTTKEVGVGTGLGLSLVHGIVADLGGGIEVNSTVGEGSHFSVYLPWSSCVEPAQRVDEAVAVGQGQTVLLIDDEETLVRLGEEMIAGLGYEPVGFTSSTEALETFRATPERFDIVLSDEAMPGMTGSELALTIRAIRADIPIVLMSGYVTPVMTRRARDAGVAEVLSKPLVARDIARSLAGALQAPAT